MLREELGRLIRGDGKGGEAGEGLGGIVVVLGVGVERVRRVWMVSAGC